MKPFALTALLLAASLSSAGAATIITETFTMATTAVIPDSNAAGLVQTINAASTIVSLDLVTVTLETTGGWNGDLFAYLWHDGVLSVLVNRPGRTTAQPDGSPTAGMVLTLADAATTDLHLAPGALSGTFQPDGRSVSPFTALDTSPRASSLGAFNTTLPGGDWHLFIADVAGGGEASLVSWSITLTGEQIPEPGTTALSLLATLGLLRRKR